MDNTSARFINYRNDTGSILSQIDGDFQFEKDPVACDDFFMV